MKTDVWKYSTTMYYSVESDVLRIKTHICTFFKNANLFLNLFKKVFQRKDCSEFLTYSLKILKSQCRLTRLQENSVKLGKRKLTSTISRKPLSWLV